MDDIVTGTPAFVPSDEKCGVFRVHNKTLIDVTGGEYGEIPFTLIVNSIGWLVSSIITHLYKMGFFFNWLKKRFKLSLESHIVN